MNATWPIVFAALVAGFLAGALVPANNEPAKLNLPGSSTASQAGGKSSPPKEPAEKRDAEKDAAEQMQASVCQKEAWPYFSNTCLDPTADIREPVRIVRARKEEPATAVSENREDNKATAQTSETSSTAPRGEAQTETKPKPSRRPRAPAGTQDNVAADTGTVEQQVRPGQQPRRRAHAREREVRFDDDRQERPARLYVTPDGRRIYVYPNSRGERWSGPSPWRDW
ncbi:MAG: hypothetical protein IT539_08550 [Bradyrhizobiaceae bacterium]|nr:hypothetical protein [Bradyrhizobiaceae bacterium]